jgi:general secretion pathway protein H
MTRPNHGRERGMTIIEVLVVLAVFALMVGMILVGFSTSRQAEVIRGVNSVGNTIRYGYDKARVNGTYFRLLINIDERSFSLQEGDDRMYLPATDRDGKIVEIDFAKEEERADRDRRAEEAYNRSLQSQVYGKGQVAMPEDGEEAGVEEAGASPAAAEADPDDPLESDANAYRPAPKSVPRRKPPLFSSFEEENSISSIAKPIVLPEGVKITYVRTDSDAKPITEGEASIYFFPRGQTQKAHIQLEDEESDGEWTIKVEPLTGRVTIVDGHEDLVLPDDPEDAEDDLGKEFGRRTF